MSTGRDDLYRLIQSMSKTEKRYFKMEAKKAGDKTANHIRLYDAINEMDEYNEEHLKKKLRKEKFIEHLSAEKRYLYQNILRSLRNFRSDKSIFAQIKSMILDFNYLIERGLYDQGERILSKVEKLASKANDQQSLLEINLKKRELMRILKNKDYQKEIAALIKETNQISKILNAELEIQDLYDRIALITDQQLKLKGQDSIENLKNEMTILDNHSDLDSAFLQLRRAQIKAFYYSLSGDLEKSTEYRTQVIDWWDNHPLIKEELFYLYQLSLNNLVSHYFSMGQDEKVLDIMAKLESEEPKNVHEQAIIFQKVSINRLLYYMGKGKFKEAKNMIPGIEEGLNKFKIPKATKMVLLGNISILYFVTENHTSCLKWFNKIINDAKSKHRLDVQRLARLLSIVSYIETGADFQIIDNFYRATYRFLKISGLTEKTHSEYVILSYLRKYISAPLSEQKTILKEFRSVLEDIKNNPRELASLGLDEFYLWVRSKLEKRSMIQLMIEQNKT